MVVCEPPSFWHRDLPFSGSVLRLGSRRSFGPSLYSAALSVRSCSTRCDTFICPRAFVVVRTRVPALISVFACVVGSVGPIFFVPRAPLAILGSIFAQVRGIV